MLRAPGLIADPAPEPIAAARLPDAAAQPLRSDPIARVLLISNHLRRRLTTTCIYRKSSNRASFYSIWDGANLCFPWFLRPVPILFRYHLALCVLACTYADAMGGLVRGPYLQMATPQAITLRWRTDPAGKGNVRYGLHPGALTNSLEGAADRTDHEIRLTGLQGAMTYYYAIEVDGESLASGMDYHFTTSPPTGSTGAFQFWALGDAGTAGVGQIAVRDAFAAVHATKPADFMLMLGDNAYPGGSDSEYQAAFFDIYPDFLRQLCVWSCLGNHETYSDPAAPPYFDIFSLPAVAECGGVPSGTERYYSFNYANAHFIVLDSMLSSRLNSGIQAEWLRADLAAVTLPWIIACWHHPPYTKGTHNSDYGTELEEMRTSFLPILENGGVDLVLCGHSHVYERSWFMKNHFGFSQSFSEAQHVIQSGDGRADGNGVYQKFRNGPSAGHGTVYVVCGASGSVGGGPLNHPAMHTSLSTLGSMIISVEDTRLDARFLDKEGGYPDHFSLLKSKNGPVLLPGKPERLALLALPGNQALLRWDDVLAETAYDIGTSVDGIHFSPAGTTSANATSFLLPDLQTGSPIQVRVTARNPSGVHVSAIHSTTYLGTLAGPTPLEQWRFIHFLTTASIPPTLESADPDGDGYINLVEYAVGSDPTRPTALPPLQVVYSALEQKLILTFHRKARPELTYRLQTTASLAPADWQTVFTSRGADNVDSIISVADFAMAPGDLRRFSRLVISVE